MPRKPFLKFIEEILPLFRPPHRAKATGEKMRQVLAEISAIEGVSSTADLNPSTIARWIETNGGRKPITTHALLRSLRSACGYAKTMHYIKVNPFDFRTPSQWLGVKGDDGPGAFDRHLSARDVLGVLDLATQEAAGGSWVAGRLQALIYTYAFTGMRKSEVLGLRVSDVDLSQRVILIKSNERRKLKTVASGAPLAIAEDLWRVLARWLPRSGCEWAFPGLTLKGPWLSGGPGVKALDQVKALGERAGVRGLTILSFRHTIGTLSEGWGFGELELQRWLRQARRRTQDSYRKPDLDVIRGTARKISFKVGS